MDPPTSTPEYNNLLWRSTQWHPQKNHNRWNSKSISLILRKCNQIQSRTVKMQYFSHRKTKRLNLKKNTQTFSLFPTKSKQDPSKTNQIPPAQTPIHQNNAKQQPAIKKSSQDRTRKRQEKEMLITLQRFRSPISEIPEISISGERLPLEKSAALLPPLLAAARRCSRDRRSFAIYSRQVV